MLVQLDVRGVFSTIFHQIWKFLLISVPIVLIALAYIIFATPIYQSNARLLIRFGQDARPDMAISQVGSGLSAEEKRGLVRSNVNILTSRDLTEELLKDITIEKAYPDIAQSTKNPNLALNAAVAKFTSDLAAQTESDAGSIDVTLSHKDPEMAKILLDKLLDLFIQRQSEIFGNPQAEVVREQATSSYEQLEIANKELFDYKDKVGIASIDEEMTLLLNTRSDLAEYLSRQELGGNAPVDTGDVSLDEGLDDSADGTINPGQVTMLPAKKGGSINSAPFPAIDEIQGRIDDLRTKELEYLQTYKPSSQLVKNIRENIEAETETLNTALNSLYAKLSELDARIIEMNKYKADYDVLQRKVELNEEVYKTAMTRLQAAEVNSDLNQRKITQISILDKPTKPERPAKPKKFLTLLLSIIAAGTLGIAACLILELLDQRFSYPEQLSAHLKEPLLASFSRKRIDASGNVETVSYWDECVRFIKRLIAEPLNSSTEIVNNYSGMDKKILSALSMGTLFQSLMAQMPTPAKKVIFITSSYKGEGATTIAWELSRYITESIKKNVLFVSYEDQRGGVSLLDVARGKGNIEAAVKRMTTGEGQLSVANLADYEESSTVAAYIDDLVKVFATLRADFDYVIIPASNILLDTTHLSLSRLADGTLFVIEADRTRAPAAKQALKNLKNSGARVAGVILNKRLYYIPKWLYRHL